MLFAVSRLATAVVLLLVALPLAAGAQQPEKTYRVAYLAAAPRSSNQALLAWFQQGMRELAQLPHFQDRSAGISVGYPSLE